MKHCAVDGCESPARPHRPWCGKHGSRYRRHGDPEKVLTIHAICTIEGCDNIPTCTRQGICDMHRARIRRHGDPSMVIQPRRLPNASYAAAHRRIKRDRGKAVGYSCTDCGHPASEWSYNHEDPSRLVSPEGLPYSLDPIHYDPRCASCHVLFDKVKVRERRRAERS